MITKDNNLKVMEIFFRSSESKFHLRELERMTGLSMPGIIKIVEKLEREGLLVSKREGMLKNIYASKNEKFFGLKRAYNLYSMCFSGLLEFLRQEYEEPEAIVLFGSYAKGDDISTSDIDIAVVTKKKADLKLSSFEKLLRRPIKVYEIRLDKAEKEFLNTLANGIVLYGYLEVFLPKLKKESISVRR